MIGARSSRRAAGCVYSEVHALSGTLRAPRRAGDVRLPRTHRDEPAAPESQGGDPQLHPRLLPGPGLPGVQVHSAVSFVFSRVKAAIFSSRVEKGGFFVVE